MKERPIIYGAEMIRAKLDGRKTRTSRPIKPQPPPTLLNPTLLARDPAAPSGYSFISDEYGAILLTCPYGQVGDVLWTREAYQITSISYGYQGEVSGYYSADGTAFNDVSLSRDEWQKLLMRKDPYRFCPARFMYKSLCRMRDEIVHVRPNRLLMISEHDCDNEGCPWNRYSALNHKVWFEKYWDSLYTKNPEYQWQANPWVWVIEFKMEGKSE